MKKLLELIRDSDTHVLSMAAALAGTALIESAALSQLLIKKSVLTEDELSEACDAVTPEVQQSINESLNEMTKILLDELSEEESK